MIGNKISTKIEKSIKLDSDGIEVDLDLKHHWRMEEDLNNKCSRLRDIMQRNFDCYLSLVGEKHFKHDQYYYY